MDKIFLVLINLFPRTIDIFIYSVMDGRQKVHICEDNCRLRKAKKLTQGIFAVYQLTKKIQLTGETF
jgi:hypothetical protein